MAPYVIQEIQQPPPPTEQMWLALADDAGRDEVEERIEEASWKTACPKWRCYEAAGGSVDDSGGSGWNGHP